MQQVVLAHISDLHFGDKAFVDRSTGGPGLKNHDPLLCHSLPDALNDIRAQTLLPPDEPLYVLMSGDLTRMGAEREFEVGEMYCRSRGENSPRRPGRHFGISVKEEYLMMIPGNHDHWKGDAKRQPAYNPAIMGLWFERTPWKRVLQSRDKALQVELFGVDSNSGLKGKKTNHLAHGKIDSTELLILEQLLNESTKAKDGTHCVRALVCHHSFWGNFPVSWFFGALELAATSKSMLLQYASKYRIAAILTGHTHDFLADRHETPALPGESAHRLAELRSATTLQGPARTYVQGFWAHRIWLDEDKNKAYWTSWAYQWDGFDFVTIDIEDKWDPFSGGWIPFEVAT
jgi:hypothetical protein